MKRLWQGPCVSIGVILLGANLASRAYGSSSVPASVNAALSSSGEQRQASSLCAACSPEELQVHLFTPAAEMLRHVPLEQQDRQSGVKDAALRYPSLRLKSGDVVWEEPAQAEEVFQKITATGWLPNFLPGSHGCVDLWTW